MRLIPMLAVAFAASTFMSPAASARHAPRLTYNQAKKAIQAKADRFAGTSTDIHALIRLGPSTYSGSVEWTRTNPTGCTGCEYDPVTGEFHDTPSTESCSVTLKAKRLPSGRIRVNAEDFICY